MASSSSSYNSPCAACKFLRRKCMPGCIFAPYFPPEEPQKFANVHKIFGASNVTKLLNELLPHQREDAVNSLAYEAEARVRDPVYGCVGAISFLQRQVQRLQKELDAANADLIRYACNELTTAVLPPPPTASMAGVNSVIQPNMAPQRRLVDHPSHHHQYYQQTSTTTTSNAPGVAFPVLYLPWNEGGGAGSGGGGGDGRM
ncbi:protein LATERAL ORGAN BOUNDARIES-like [Pyrus communis]|uniref:protein LATERAL ORGAN BOUNDARIES-like n=1 Tax=Pyrus communis TaxID=23211 RepID=UPI0035BFC7BF